MTRLARPKSLRSDRLLDALAPYERFLIVTHDNPDPDAIAGGWAIVCLITERLERPARLIGGGAIVRAENRHMVELLRPPIELVDRIDVGPDVGTVLVDCHWEASNHLLSRNAVEPVAVIDHHPHESRRPSKYRDVRIGAAATASIAAGYLREQHIEPGDKLATGLLYAIRTETRGCEFHYSRLDRSVLTWLTARADPELLAEIESAPLSRAYFADLVLAVQNAFVFGDAAFCLLPRAEGPEIVGEVADLLVRCQGVRRVLCGAVVGPDVFVSVRTAAGAQDASQLLHDTLHGIGVGGGHAHRAGGKIAGRGRRPASAQSLDDELRDRWLSACGIESPHGTRLIAKQEILDSLQKSDA